MLNQIKPKLYNDVRQKRNYLIFIKRKKNERNDGKPNVFFSHARTKQ